MKKLSKLPYLELNINSILGVADNIGLMCMQSSIPGSAYIFSDDDVVLITGSKGYTKFKKKEIPAIIEEIKAIYEWNK